MAGIRFSDRRAHGVTLVEMLVVISILAMLMGLSVPLMAPAMDGRRIREASRQINVYFGGARNHAMATNRSVGVMIKPFDGLPGCSMTLDQVECPAPYSGDTLNADAQVRATVENGKQTGVITATFAPAGSCNLGLVTAHPAFGDIIQFGHQGPSYVITAKNATAGTITAKLYNQQAQLLPWPSGSLSAPVRYAIYRRPIPSGVAPLQLPAGAVVDLQFSGIDADNNGDGQPDSFETAPVIIMFSPQGAVDRVYSQNQWLTGRAVVPIHLLVGKREKIPTTAGEENWRDFNNLWVTLNPQTGLVTTTKVASTNSIPESRAFALQALSEGGR